MYTESLNEKKSANRIVRYFAEHRYAVLAVLIVMLAVMLFSTVLLSNASDQDAYSFTRDYTMRRSNWNPSGEQGRSYYYDYIGGGGNSVGWWDKGWIKNYANYYIRDNAARAAGYGAFEVQTCMSIGGSSGDEECYFFQPTGGSRFSCEWGQYTNTDAWDSSGWRAYFRITDSCSRYNGSCTWVNFSMRSEGYDGSRFSTKYLDNDFWVDLYCRNTNTGRVRMGYLDGNEGYYTTSKRVRIYVDGNGYRNSYGYGAGVKTVQYNIGNGWVSAPVTGINYGGYNSNSYFDVTVYASSGSTVSVQFWDWQDRYTSGSFTVARLDGQSPTNYGLSRTGSYTRNIRYIRDWIVNGSNANAWTHWAEIMAFDKNGSNLAKGKTVTANFSSGVLGRIVDGNASTDPYTDGGTGSRYVTVNLNGNYDITDVVVYHYYGDSRTYYGTKTEVSADGSNWITIFDSSVQGTYAESSLGHRMPVAGTNDPSTISAMASDAQSLAYSNSSNTEASRGGVCRIDLSTPGGTRNYTNRNYFVNSYRGGAYGYELSLRLIAEGGKYRQIATASWSGVSGNGEYYYSSWDYAWNGMTYRNGNNYTINNYDTIAPTINSYSYNPAWAQSYTRLYFTCKDTGTSGCARPYFGCEKPTVTGGSTGAVTLISWNYTSGAYYYYYYCDLYSHNKTYTINVKDMAGNTASLGGIVPHIDYAAPSSDSHASRGTKYGSTTLIDAATTYSYGNVTVSLNAKESGGSGGTSGIQYIDIQLSATGSSWSSYNTPQYGTRIDTGDGLSRTTYTSGGWGTAFTTGMPSGYSQASFQQNYNWYQGPTSKAVSFTTSYNTSSYRYYRIYVVDWSGRGYYSSAIQVYKDSVAPSVWSYTGATVNAWAGSTSGTYSQSVNFRSSYGWSGATYYLRQFKYSSGTSYPAGGYVSVGTNLPNYTYTQTAEGKIGYQLKIVSGAGYPYETAQNLTYTRIDNTAPSASVSFKNSAGTTVPTARFTGSNWFNEGLYIYLDISEKSFDTSGIRNVYATVVTADRTVNVAADGTMTTSGSGSVISAPANYAPKTNINYTVDDTSANPRYRTGQVQFTVNGPNKYTGGTAANLAPKFFITVIDGAGHVRNVYPSGQKVQVDTYGDYSVGLTSKQAKVTASSSLSAYNSTLANNWVYGQIEFTLRKDIGLSGGNVKYYIGTTATTAAQVKALPDSAWLSAGLPSGAASGVSITSSDYSLSSKLTISNVNITGRVFFALFPNSVGINDTIKSPKTILEEETKGKSIFCAVDITPPTVVSHEFQYGSTYANNAAIKAKDYAYKNLYLYVYTTDIQTGQSTLGSDVKTVSATYGSGNTVTFVQDTTYTSDPLKKRWRSTNALGSNSYSIKLTDGVGNVNQDGTIAGRGKTHIPLIDTTVPSLSINTGTYVPGQVTRQTVNMTVNANFGNSGAMIYYIMRSPTDTASLASNFGSSQNFKTYNAGTSINNGSGYYTLKYDYCKKLSALGKEGADGRVGVAAGHNAAWVVSNTVYTANTGFQTTYSGAAKSSLQIGLNGNQTMKIQLDFVIINGAGIATYASYGVVWVDKQVPVVDNDLVFILNDGSYATGIFDNYTNGTATADVTVSDPSDYGSGVSSVVINGTPLTPELKDIVRKVNGVYTTIRREAYTVSFNKKQEYKIQCYDNAGNASAVLSYTPQIDMVVPTVNVDNLNKDYSDYVNTDVTYKVIGQYGMSGGTMYYSLDGSNYTIFPAESKTDFVFKKYQNGSFVNSDIKAKIVYQDNRNDPGQNGTATQMSYTITLTKDIEQTFYFKLKNGVTVTSEQRFEKRNGSFYYVNGNLVPLGYTIDPVTQKRVYTGTGAPIPTTESINRIYKIDKTAPTLNTRTVYVLSGGKTDGTTLDESYYSMEGTSWTNKGARVIFTLKDNVGTLTGAGGIVASLSKANSAFGTVNPTSGQYSFDMDTYQTYVIKVRDRLGNETSSLFSFLPRIDTVVPTITLSSYKMLDGNKSIGNYPEGRSGGYTINDLNTRWTNYDVRLAFVTTMGLSGARVEHSTNGTSYSTLSDSTVAALSDTAKKGESAVGETYSQNGSVNHYYRIVTGAGTVVNCGFDADIAADSKYFNVRIDKTTPVVSVSAKSGSNTYVKDTWTNQSVTLSASPVGGLDVGFGWSGYYAEYSIDNSNWTVIGDLYDYMTATTQTSKIRNLVLQDTTNLDRINNYFFRLRSQAGLTSIVYDFGKVKIDKVTPEMTISAKQISNGDIVTGAGGKIVYNETYDKSSSFQLGEWTYQNIIIKIIMTKIGPSGAAAYYTDESLTTPSASFAKWKNQKTNYSDSQLSNLGWARNAVEISNGNTLAGTSDEAKTAYLLVTENQNAAYFFKAVTNAGNSAIVSIGGNIKKDDATPYVYLSPDTSAVKSVKWTSEDVDDYYKWFTSNYRFIFNVGRYTTPGTSGSVEMKENESGFTLYVRTKVADGNWSDWGTNVGDAHISITKSLKSLLVSDNDALGDVTYEFKITSGAGLTFFPKESYLTESNRSLMGASNMFVKNLENDVYGEFTLRVDTTDYTAGYVLKLAGSTAFSEVVSDEFATITYKKNGEEFSEQQLRDGATYKRGDKVTVSIVADESHKYAAKPYYYEYKFSDFGNLLVENYIEDESPAAVKDLATVVYDSNKRYYGNARVIENSFSFDILNESYMATAYFRKYITIDYATASLSQHKQGVDETFSNIIPVTVSTTQNVFGSGTYPIVINLAFKVNYIDTLGYNLQPGGVYSDYPTDVGTYDIAVSITNDENDTYKIINATTEKERIYYFLNDGTAESPYKIRNEVDFDYMRLYNNPDTKYNFLNKRTEGDTMRNYYYKQSQDILLTYANVFTESFAGIYNGGNFIIGMEEMTLNGSFSIFNKVKGTVQYLGVYLEKLTVNNAAYVGFIATEVDGGTIDNCYAVGDLYVSNDSGTANVGGIAGSLTGAGRISNTFTDLTVYNLGKSFAGNLGGVIGFINGGIFYKNYAVGAIEIYDIDVNVVKAGTIAGSVAAITPAAEGESATANFHDNSYLRNNLFINDDVIEYTSATTNAGIGYIDTASVDYFTGDVQVKAVTFNVFINQGVIAETSISDVIMESKKIKNIIKTRITELGISQGEGTAASPFVINSIEALDFIDRYAWAYFVQNEDIVSAGTFRTIAAHKVFTGNYNGQNHSVSDITIVSSDVNTGIFGQIKGGTISNLKINNLEISVNYTGTNDTYVGGLAAIALKDAKFDNITVRGNTSVYTPNALAIVGGMFGYTHSNTDLHNLLSLQNVKTEVGTQRTIIGGMVGLAEMTSMSYIYSLARVEAYTNFTGVVGSVVGEMDACRNVNDIGVSNVYALENNTYYGGEPNNVLYGATNNDTYLGNLMSFTDLRSSGAFDGGLRLDVILDTVYPLTGKGTELKPFVISSVDEFMYIYDYLYAAYVLRTDINFAAANVNFKTIGVGSRFTGSINGTKDEASWSEGETRTHEISGLTDSLVYYNAGTIQNLRINIEYGTIGDNGVESSVDVYSDIVFGAVAVYNSGKIKGITAGGSININVIGTYSAYVGGFVGQDVGGEFDAGEQQQSFTQASLNQIIIKVTTKMGDVGGFIGNVSGPTKLAYAVSVGDISVFGSESIKVGALIGGVYVSEGVGGFVYAEETSIDPDCEVKLNGVSLYDESGSVARAFGYQV